MDTSRLFLRETTRVPPHALLLFGATAAELDIERVKQTGRVCRPLSSPSAAACCTTRAAVCGILRRVCHAFSSHAGHAARQVDLAAGVRVRVSPEGALLLKLLRRELDKLLVRMGGAPAGG